MKILVLTQNPTYKDLCKEAFANVASEVSEAKPLKTLEDPIESVMEAAMVVSDNLSAAVQFHTGYKLYVSIEGAPLKNKDLKGAYVIALRYQEPGESVLISSVEVTADQSTQKEILKELRKLAALPHDVPSVEHQSFLGHH